MFKRPEDVKKSEDVVTFDMTSGGLKRTDSFLQPGGNPKPTDATREPAHPASSFPGSASIVDRPANQDAPRPLRPYDITEDVTSGGTMPSTLFLEPDADEVVNPKDFAAPAPAQRPQGAAPVRMGHGYVLKSEFEFEG